MTIVKIDSTDLIHWADRHASRGALPELVRRLLRQREPVRWIDMPCGDSVGKPGWDGLVTAGPGGHFAPEGLSCWEMGTSGDAGGKANDDYRTRTEATPPARRAATAFVFVTPRRWPGKRGWIDARAAEGAWREVRAYDADDLERWLDELPPVARWFAATQLGRQGVEDWGDPVIGWDDGALSLDRNELSWLTWRARLTALFGRHEQRAELLRWAREGGGVSFRFLIGDGGTGKTRLAHEIADELSRDPEGRAAGLVTADRPLPLDAGRAGCFLLVDYPEEKRAAVRARLLQLANESQDPARAVRVLFLTRNDDRYWGPLTDDTGAHTRMAPPIHLPPGIGTEEAWALFQSALERVPRKPGTPDPAGIDEAAFTAWLARVETNQRPLLIAAAAIQAVADPARPVFTLNTRAVIDALARREAARLRRLASAHRLNEHALERLTALAAVRGALDTPTIRRLADPVLDLGLGPREGLIDRLLPTGLLEAVGTLRPPEPDIVAASFLVETLAARPADAPDWLWAAIEGAEAEAVKRLGRLTWDAEYVLLRHDHRISRWLAAMLEGRVERCRTIEKLVMVATLPGGLAAAGVAVFRTLLNCAVDEEEKARFLGNLSTRLSDLGDEAGALTAAEEAVDVYLGLASANPRRFRSALANTLNNLSLRLFRVGKIAESLTAVQRAVIIKRRLVAEKPADREFSLAGSLDNLALRQSDAGQNELALETNKEAVRIYRRLIFIEPGSYASELAGCLNNLSHRLSSVGKASGAHATIGDIVDKPHRLAAEALNVIKEAVEIYLHLASVDPARHEPDLAISLNNLSLRLSDMGDRAGALMAIKEAVELYRRLASANPNRYADQLAGSLANFAHLAHGDGQREEAIAIMREAVKLIAPMAWTRPEALPAKWHQAMQETLAEWQSDVAP